MAVSTPATIDSVSKALTYKYIATDGPAPTVDKNGLIALLEALPEETLVGNTLLLEAVLTANEGTVLAPTDLAIVSSIDECAKSIFKRANLELETEQLFHFALPAVAIELLRRPDMPLHAGPNILTVLDQLVDALIGWDSNLGKAGEKVYAEAQKTIDTIQKQDADYKVLSNELGAFVSKEQGRVNKLEERLAASETGRLRSQESKNIAASMINEAMAGKELTADITSFLKGPWYDSAQLFVLRNGLDSEEWFRAVKLTETLIWTYQPIELEGAAGQQEKQKLYRIIEHLPGEVRELLVALEHDKSAVEEALEVIETEQFQMVSDMALEYAEFEPIECDDELAGRSKVSRVILKKVASFEPGQWFLYQTEEINVRIKLILNLEDVRQLLFTNRNGMKVLQTSFDEFAYYLSSRVARPLRHDTVFTNTFAAHYRELLDEHASHIQAEAERKAEVNREAEATEAARRKAEAEAAEAERAKEEARRKRLEEEKAARLEQARAEASKEENADRVAELNDRIKELAIGSWLKLPGPDGQLEECKLAVRIAASDKMIFVNRAGTKIGEYSSEQLVQLLVAGQGAIQDEGVEFEDTLAQVVSRLRQDRNKSYDDLTGE